MDLFHIIEDAQCVTRSNGVCKQCKVYFRGDRLYAGYGAGFIRIGGHGCTSHPGVQHEGYDIPPGVTIMKGPTGEPIYKGETK